ncbi:oryzin precursor [Xylariomycetidae sp. FL2044]|nr:oryzin precursor [Xylariomycetidae sp. FL2044]
MGLLRSSLLVLTTSLLAASAARLPQEQHGEFRAQPIPDQYIVTLKKGIDVEEHMLGVTTFVANVADRGDVQVPELGVRKQWEIGSWNAYSATFDPETMMYIQDLEDVAFVEPNYQVYTAEYQDDAPWGLASISHRDTGAKGYGYDDNAGEGTYAYLVDTGIRTTHQELVIHQEGRAVRGFDVEGNPDFGDVVGHGTHCAGTIASKTFGVAKKATVVGVKIFDHKRRASSESFLDGFHWAMQDIAAHDRANKSVVSASIGGPRMEAINLALEEAYKKGVVSVVAAGNYRLDASLFSPASAPYAVTVGAMTPNRTLAKFTDFGPVVDIFAPGVHVKSLFNSNDTATRFADGTSMSTPHVSGLLLYLRSVYPDKTGTPAESVELLKQLATKDSLSDTKGSPNLVAFNGYKEG